jgi:5-methylcytosine-specific restriction endonuclease McrA
LLLKPSRGVSWAQKSPWYTGPMKVNILATAVARSDQDLLSRIDALAGHEREATAELVAHLAALELRPSLYAAQGYGSLFAYCTEALRLSEDAACNRIEAARACRSFPVILDLLASGSLTLTAVRMLTKHLTPENHQAVLARARHQRKEQIQALVAELAPKPDVVASVRKLPAPTLAPPPEASMSAAALLLEMGSLTDPSSESGAARNGNGSVPPPPIDLAVPRLSPAPRPVVQALAPGRYCVQFTIGQEAYDKLRRLQTLLRREVPSGDAGVIFERFVDVLLDKVERDKLGKRGRVRASATTKRRSSEARSASPAYENRIRSGTDRTDARDTATGLEQRQAPSRHIPSAVKRAVWFRDRAQCAFLADTGHRCSERSFLELHHIHPYALDGPPTVGNVSLRCRRHNQYEAEMVFGGPRRGSG